MGERRTRVVRCPVNPFTERRYSTEHFIRSLRQTSCLSSFELRIRATHEFEPRGWGQWRGNERVVLTLDRLVMKFMSGVMGTSIGIMNAYCTYERRAHVVPGGLQHVSKMAGRRCMRDAQFESIEFISEWFKIKRPLAHRGLLESKVLDMVLGDGRLVAVVKPSGKENVSL
ncbi:hypothetical protein BDN72DRAFT_857209 [Pluteus cervinus]|uniref:Uncharacterized protein n=1 Tax=Pluteus cervinus TaxID=181527 RepID=A0ACD3AW66_9AGAR|nr:hypothetical protein BDN72DRAFT_857209 [Pluteus cervinus]